MHVKDLQLAFLVSRLIEARDGAGSSPTTMLTSTGGLGSGGGFGLGGLGGGGFGGGFGSVGRGGRDNEDKVNVAAVHESIGGASRKLLRDEFLPTFDGECDVPKAWKRSVITALHLSVRVFVWCTFFRSCNCECVLFVPCL